MKQIINKVTEIAPNQFKTIEGTFDFNGKKVRLNGKVLDKYSLCAAMERLNYKRFQYATLYTYDVCNYETIKSELMDYLKENLESETTTTTETAKSEKTETTKKNLSDKVLSSKNGVQFQYVLENIEDCSRANDEGITFESDYDKIKFFFDVFNEEFNYIQNRKRYPNLQNRICEFLRGLPSCINIDYTDYDIITNGKKWGYCQTEKKETAFIENWFNMIAFRLIQIAHKLGFDLNYLH